MKPKTQNNRPGAKAFGWNPSKATVARLLAEAKFYELSESDILKVFQQWMSDITDDFVNQMWDKIANSDYCYPDRATAQRVADRIFANDVRTWHWTAWVDFPGENFAREIDFFELGRVPEEAVLPPESQAQLEAAQKRAASTALEVSHA